jgi:ABC-2 type transport system ATP-binding protein
MTAAIQAEGLTKRYGATLALDRLDLDVAKGECYGYLGPNGAGKTTTIRLLLGLHRPDEGRALIAGHDAWSDPVAAHRRVGYVASEPTLWPSLTGAETLEYFANLHGGTDRAYRDLLVDRFDFDSAKKVRALSKGNRQKIQLIAAFATRADVLILDEPTSGLDPLMEAAFRATVAEAREHGQTIFLSSHVLSEVEILCDRIGILRTGKLIDQGTLRQLRHLSARTVEVTFAESLVSRRPSPGSAGPRRYGTAAASARPLPGQDSRQPRALARGDLSDSLPGRFRGRHRSSRGDLDALQRPSERLRTAYRAQRTGPATRTTHNA